MFADIILPVSVPNTYTYGVPIEFHDELKIGQRVEVEFGKRKRYAGVVVKIHNQQPEHYQTKPILSVIDHEPLIKIHQLKFWKWMSTYYMANIGDVCNAALPSALRLSSESSIQLLIEDEIDVNELTDDEYLIFEALSQKRELSFNDAQIILGKETIYPVLSSLIEQRIIALKETLKHKYKPKTKAYIQLHKNYLTESAKQTMLNDLDRAPKQLDIALTYLSQFPNNNPWIDKKELMKKAKVSSQIVKSIVEKGYFVEEHKEVERLNDDKEGELNAELTPDQQQAKQQIDKAFAEQKTCLLHGITGSGKTHIYIKCIEDAIEQGKQVLYLLPEIALTSQIIRRLQDYFGGDVGIYHSKFNDAERVEIWNKTLNGQYKVILGARSAVFLPFNNLGLIIVDEEHESSFKQYDPSPRYNARDASLYLANQFKANVLLGSATPSFESYFNAQQNKYELIELTSRYGNNDLPTIELVNMLRQNIPGKTYQLFSKRLIDELKQSLELNEQAILLRNRRGYNSFVQCSKCAHSIKCENCDVSLTYHKFRDQLECHYCGFKQKVPYRCPACGNNELVKLGLGTERIQDELGVFLPKAKIGRMDLDTTRSKYGHEKIIEEFEQKKLDVLVGTQMVAKGLHFSDVNLVGVISADAILKFPDFRASERAFQLLEQVSGRAGRHKKQGLVIIQVRDEQDVVLKYLKLHDYKAFYEATINERWEWKYPPFYRLITVTLKHKDWKTCYEAALLLANTLRKQSDQIIKGPSEPLVNKVRNQFIQEIHLTLERKRDTIKSTKQLLAKSIDAVSQTKGFSQVRIFADVDPM